MGAMSSGVKRLTALEGAMARAEGIVTVTVFLVMLGLMVVQVLYRYVLEAPLAWSEEMIRYLFVATSFVGAALASKERHHIEVDVLSVFIDRMEPERKKRCNRLFRILSDITCLAVLVVFFRYSLGFMEYMHGSSQKSAAMELPMEWVVATMLAGTALAALHYLIKLVLNLAGEDLAESGEIA